MSEDSTPLLDRRAVLGSIAAGGLATLSGCSFLESDEDNPATEVGDERALELAAAFAPVIYFDRDEQWFPTDPRAYESEQDGETVVNGFDALEGYVQEQQNEDPPDPAVFYHAIEYEDSPLAVVQFWMYSAFDQFTTNFHWHDWELLQVFLDTDTGDPQLYVASSHSRSVPNNEFLDPDPDRRPRILTELGSHSSGLSTNENEEHFQRFPLDGDVADITNSVVDGIEDLVTIPLAYGLPRDEGFALPYVVPELDGNPIYEHDRLPSVEASDLVSDALTVRSFEDLQSPPANLPDRETGLQFEYQGREVEDADATYDLRPSSDLEHIADFVGPQLSFEFSVPEFAEDAIAGHITTTGVPWKGGRYTDPASDISEARHRQALADRYDAIGAPSGINQVVARVTNAVSDDDAPDGEGLTTVESPLELFALFESEPEAVPTFRGVAVVQDVPDGDHRLTVNGAGVAPHSETVPVSGDGETTVAGADGEIPVVARENATKLEVDTEGADSDLTDLAVEDDFAGRLYDAPLSGPDAVYVHRGGAFTAEVRDTDDEVGAFRVNPDTEERVRIDRPDTGKGSLARYVADVAEETRAQVAALDTEEDDDDDGETPGGGNDGSENAVQGLATALEAVAEAADRAAERAAKGDRGGADQQLDAVATRLERVGTRLSEAREDLPSELARATENRLEQADRRSEQARQAGKL
ncbi:MAG: hypothetical protein V5A27_12815 [Halapricum sp.]